MQIMKKNLFKPVMLFLMAMTFVACSDDDSNNDSNNNSNNSTEETAAIVSASNWVITNFIDSGQDETSDFNGYTFSFNANGTVVATNGTNTVNGTWSITDSNSSSDDDNYEDDDFNLNFPPGDDLFEDLNDDWDFISVSNTKIELIDISGGNGGTDYLTFEKN